MGKHSAFSLEQLFHSANQQHFQGELPLPRLRWNSRLSSSAGRFCPPPRRSILSNQPTIEIATYLSELENAEFHIRDTLLHEMIHYLLWHHGRPYGHTAEFTTWMKKVGTSRYNQVPKNSAAKYWYECQHCLQKMPARKRWKNVACLACCKKYARGKFDSRYLLIELSSAISIAPNKEAQPAAATMALESTQILADKKNETKVSAEPILSVSRTKEPIKKVCAIACRKTI